MKLGFWIDGEREREIEIPLLYVDEEEAGGKP